MRFQIRARYRKAILTIEQQGKREDHEYDGGFYILTSRGWLKLSGEGGRSVEVDAGIRSGWCSGMASVIEIVSEPLSL
jgi:hypothetical protein